jgi:phospholipid/cholesterol/gamma-HCH transport system substrate-binding protein
VAIQRGTLEILVGLLALAAWAGFVVFAFNVNQHKVSGYDVYATFAHIDGLEIHADVRLAGIRVGEVAEDSFLPATDQARIRMVIEPGYDIPSDSAAIVASDGLFGGKFIKIDPGGDPAPLKAGQSFAYVQDSVDFWRLLQRVVAGAEAQHKANAAKAKTGKSE